MIKTYGTSEEEDLILDNVKSREIVQTVLNYGVNQKQGEYYDFNSSWPSNGHLNDFMGAQQ